jgi:K+-dependent Na+/Ca+ exchanger-like protein
MQTTARPKRRRIRRSHRAVRVGGAFFLAMCALCLFAGILSPGDEDDSLALPALAASGSSRGQPQQHARHLLAAGGGCKSLNGTSATAGVHGVACSGDGAGTVAYCIVIIFFAFLGLAIVCDEFFQPSLEEISEVLSLSPDVAGATFLAAGSSAPELFTSIGDVFGPANSMGLGTIVGSAMFNILVIVALSASVATGSLKIDHRPVLRDVCFYSASIASLALFFGDGVIETWEAATMVAAYGMYIVWMVFNQRMFGVCCPAAGGGGGKVVPTSDEEAAAAAADKLADEVREFERLSGSSSIASTPGKGPVSESIKTRRTMRATIHKEEDGGAVDGAGALAELAEVDEEAAAAGGAAIAAPATGASGGNGGNGAGAEGEEEDGERLEFPSDGSPLDKALFVLSLPLLWAFTITIPDCATDKWKKWYGVSFVMSIVWIALLCHYMVWAASMIGCIWEIDPIVMGVVVLAVGTSVPDAIGSMIAAKSGEADMAIANAIGSNIFDIFLGLGLPWLLFNLLKGKA